MIETEQPKIDAYDGYFFTPQVKRIMFLYKSQGSLGVKTEHPSSFLLNLRATGGARTTQTQPQSELVCEFLWLQ